MVPRLRAIVIALVLCSALPAAGEQPTGNSPASSPPNAESAEVSHSNQPKAEQNQRAPTGEVSVLQPTQPPQDQASGRQSESAHEGVGAQINAHGDNERIIANFTVALAAATFLLAVATFYLAWYTRGVQKETKRLADQAVIADADTKRSIKIAEDNAVQTTLATQAALDSVASERAWLLFDAAAPLDRKNVNYKGLHYEKILQVVVPFTNSGRSPALDVKSQTRFAILNNSNDATYFELGPMPPRNGGVIGPTLGGQTEFFILAGKDLEDFVDGTTKLEVVSKIQYKTIYHQDQIYFTELNAIIKFDGYMVMSDGTKITGLRMTPVGHKNNIGSI